MKRVLFTLVAILSLSACQEEPAPSAHLHTSPDGHEYRLIHLPGNEFVSIQVAWATDWAYREGVNQAAPYIGTELILAGGAEGYPAGEVLETFADLNAEGSLYPTPDNIIGALNFERESMSDVLQIANAHLRAPLLDEMWFARIRGGFAQNIHEASAQGIHRAFDTARWAVFGTHPVRVALSMDEPGVIEALTREDIDSWRSETITNAPEVIVIVGDLSEEEASSALDQVFEGLPPAASYLERVATPDFSPRRILLHVPDIETTMLGFIAAIPPSRLGQEFEDIIITQSLGGGAQSVLFEAIRTELRASYGFEAGLANYTRENRILFMAGAVETTQLEEAEQAVRSAYAEFIETGPSGPLANRISNIEENIENMVNFVSDTGRSELQAALDGHGVGISLELPDLLASITEESIMQRLTEHYPASTEFLVVAVSPDASALPGACVITEPRDAVNCE